MEDEISAQEKSKNKRKGGGRREEDEVEGKRKKRKVIHLQPDEQLMDCGITKLPAAATTAAGIAELQLFRERGKKAESVGGGIVASITVRSYSGMIWNKVCGLCQTVATGGYGEEMGFGNSENKSRLSVSTAQVQTPAAVAGGDALAGRVVERPPQRKTR
ncbi:hypothetical protein DPX16_11782 [Anabarilius grahami]|uniref:Uncharacterized protein n=1 Tax=Anabarilius grahami TaxID=495550 RepID=A0A3N0Z825_ANAGA|nr:hypothetical protein DPX16_11782 [Anabarilius grahami]